MNQVRVGAALGKRKYRFHVVALPHAVTSKRVPWCACAYTQKVLNFCKMMMSLGHEVYHYGAEGSEVGCTEHVETISQRERECFWTDSETEWQKRYFDIEWDPNEPYWQLTNSRAVVEIERRAQEKDFLCLIAGTCNEMIAKHFDRRMLPVEYGIGYRGVFSPYRVFESLSHMHKAYGLAAADGDGSCYDAVIPNYYDPDDFDVEVEPRDVGKYVLYVGRMNIRKGLGIIRDLLPQIEYRGLEMVMAGQGGKQEAPGNITYENGERIYADNATYLGTIGGEQRNDLMRRAYALLMPTTYVEPFGGVQVEAQLCGCPVITTDWGAFTETVEQGGTGYRCHVLKDFVKALDEVKHLDRRYIRNRALSLWSTDVVRHQYQEYFDRIYDVWDKGWSTLP